MHGIVPNRAVQGKFQGVLIPRRECKKAAEIVSGPFPGKYLPNEIVAPAPDATSSMAEG